MRPRISTSFAIAHSHRAGATKLTRPIRRAGGKRSLAKHRRAVRGLLIPISAVRHSGRSAKSVRAARRVAPAALKARAVESRFSPLCLPSIGADVPRQIEGTSASARLAEIAQGFMDAGVLRDEHWRGDLVSSIDTALSQWVNLDLGLAGEMENLKLDLNWLDDVSENDNYLIRAPHLSGFTGAFVLDLPYAEPDLFTVGYWLSRFDQVLPGIAADILHALCWASEDVFNALTPPWAYQKATENAEMFEQEFVEEEMNGASPAAFERLLPSWIYRYDEPDRTRLLAARGMAPAASIENEVTDRVKVAAECALEILELQPQCHGANQVWGFAEFDTVPGVAIRWQCDHDTDPTGWVMDEAIDVSRQSGEISPLVALIPFGVTEVLPIAVEKLAATLRLARAINDLLQIIHDERPITAKEQVRIQV